MAAELKIIFIDEGGASSAPEPSAPQPTEYPGPPPHRVATPPTAPTAPPAAAEPVRVDSLAARRSPIPVREAPPPPSFRQSDRPLHMQDLVGNFAREISRLPGFAALGRLADAIRSIIDPLRNLARLGRVERPLREAPFQPPARAPQPQIRIPTRPALPPRVPARAPIRPPTVPAATGRVAAAAAQFAPRVAGMGVQAVASSGAAAGVSAGGAAAAGSGMGGAAAGGALAGVAAAAGPAAIAIAALAAAVAAGVAAVKMFANMVEQQAQKLQDYSPVVSLAIAQNEVRREMVMMRRAERIGPQVARWEQWRGELADELTDLKTSLLAIVMDLADTFAPILERIPEAVTLVTEMAEHAAHLLRISNPILMAMDPQATREAIAAIPQDARDIKKALKQLIENTGEKEDPLNDPYLTQFHQILPNRLKRNAKQPGAALPPGPGNQNPQGFVFGGGGNP